MGPKPSKIMMGNEWICAKQGKNREKPKRNKQKSRRKKKKR